MDTTEVTTKTPAEIKKESAKANRVAAMARARAAKKDAHLKESNFSKLEEVQTIMSKPKDDSSISFMTEIDLDKNGNPKASYPFYQNPRHMEDLKEDKRKLEKAVAAGFVDADHIGEVKSRIAQYGQQLDAYEKHLPEMEKNIDRINKMSKDLADVIAPTMFTRKEMRDGLVDPHEEARRMSEPIIELPKELCETAIRNGVRVDSSRKVSRDGATRLWQMCQRKLGGSTDAEYLRRD